LKSIIFFTVAFCRNRGTRSRFVVTVVNGIVLMVSPYSCPNRHYSNPSDTTVLIRQSSQSRFHLVVKFARYHRTMTWVSETLSLPQLILCTKPRKPTISFSVNHPTGGDTKKNNVSWANLKGRWTTRHQDGGWGGDARDDPRIIMFQY
jgi:hypothetical protein